MAVTKQFSFNSTAESWSGTANGATSWAAIRDTTAGSDSTNDTNSGDGTLQARRTGKSNSDGTPYYEWSGTWEDLGVPSGAIVTAANLSYDWRCTEYTTGANTSSYGPAELRDSGATLRNTFSTSATFSATTSWATKTGTNQTGLTDASNTSIKLRIGAKPNTGNSTSAAVTLRLDWIVVTVTYEQRLAAAPTGSGVTAGALTLTKPIAGAMTGSAATAGGIALTVPLAGGLTAAGTLAGALESTNLVSGAMTASATAAGAIAITVENAGAATTSATVYGDIVVVPAELLDPVFDEMSDGSGDPIYDLMGTSAAASQLLAGDATGSAVTAGAIAVTKASAGAATASATISGGLTNSAANLAGAMTASATASAALYQASLPTGTDAVFDVQTISASPLFDLVSVGAGFAGALTARATVAGALAVTPAQLLAGAATASAVMAGRIGNRNPVWAALSEILFTEGIPGTFDLYTWVSDQDGDPITVGVVPNLPAGFSITQSPARLVYNGVPQAGDYGDYLFWGDDGILETFSGAASATGSPSGTLTVTRDPQLLSGAATGSATVAGGASVTKPLAGALTASAAAAAASDSTVFLAGGATGAAVASGRLVGTVEVIDLAGGATASASGAAGLMLDIFLAGNADAVGGGFATLSGDTGLVGDAPATAVAAGDVTMTKFLSGAMTAGGTLASAADTLPRSKGFRTMRTPQFRVQSHRRNVA